MLGQIYRGKVIVLYELFSDLIMCYKPLISNSEEAVGILYARRI